MRDLKLFYDGECPICSRYADYVTLRNEFDVELIDARTVPDRIREFKADGYDINAGMILLVDGVVHHGAEAAIQIDRFTGRAGTFDRVARPLVSRAPWLVRAGYPLAKAVRRISLKMLGRDPDFHT